MLCHIPSRSSAAQAGPRVFNHLQQLQSIIVLRSSYLACLMLLLRGRNAMAYRQKWLRFICFFLCIVAVPCQAQSDAANQWKRQIVLQLSLHKHFLLEACSKSGEARVGFTIDRAGKLISATIVSGTGVPALDEAALQMVRSAQPFPPAPPDVAGGNLKFIASVMFAKAASISSGEAMRSEQGLGAVMRSICRGC
jgi:TonB family protein